MDYRSKYLKYKEKYLEYKKKSSLMENASNIMKKPIAGITKLGDYATRDIRQIAKKVSGKEAKEIEEINRIVDYLKSDPDYPKSDKQMNVSKFLEFVKNKLSSIKKEMNEKDKYPQEKIDEMQKTVNDLNYLLKKHYMCKNYQTSFVYNVPECKLTHNDNQL